jgi:DNA mismatch repair protein PMS2
MESQDEISEIKPLGEESIRRIVAEQAISDLSSIVKELVDNAIDAESTTIKIRLFGHGLDIIEVSDDGGGVPIPSRPHLATRYATSKISSFEDIYSGTGLTLGFRGEALFSMACLSSQLVVATRTDNDQMAQKMEFKRDGSLDETSVASVHRKVGTTVAVVKPFANVPARRADMVRRIRAERSKLFRLMESCK